MSKHFRSRRRQKPSPGFWVFIMVFLAGGPAAAVCAEERLPVEAFASLPKVQAIDLSPDGKHLAYLRNEGGQTYLFTHDLAARERRAITRSDNEKYVFNWLRWVSNEDVVLSLYFPDRRYGVETGETRLISAGPGRDGVQVLGVPRVTPYKQQHLGQIQDRIISDLPDDPEHILVALDLERPTLPGVYQVNVRTGRQKRIQRAREPIRHWVADQQGKVRAAFGFDYKDSLYSLWLRRTDNDKWRMVSEWKVLQQPNTTPLGFGLDPRHLYVRADHNGNAAVFRLDTDSDDYARELVAADPGYDIEGELVHSSQTGEAIGVKHAHAPGQVLYFDGKPSSLQRSVDGALPDTLNTIIGESVDGTRYLVHASASNVPGKYYLGDRNKSTLHAVVENYPLLTGQDLSRTRSISFEARDGLEIEGYLSLPPDSNGLDLPAILLPHGGPMSRDYGGFNYWVQFFTNRGYAVLQPNFRGSSGYGFEFKKQAVQNYGGTMQDDLEDAADWLIERGIADEKRICIAGASYGGYAALMGVVKTPDKYRCAISFAGVTDLVAVRDKARFYLNRNIVREQVGTDSAQLKRVSPRYQAEKIRAPVLLAHGARDRTVMIDQARDMAVALKKAGRNYVYLEFENGSHGLTLEKNRLDFFNAMDAFLAEHLPVKN